MREICDEYDVLLVSDEAICAFGRIGSCSPATTSATCPHHHLRQGPDVGLRADGRDDRLRPALRAVQQHRQHLRARLHLGRPSGRRAAALANLDVFEREGINDHVKNTAPAFRAHPGEATGPADRRRRPRRGLLLRDRTGQGQGHQGRLDDEVSEWLLRSFLSVELFEAGLYCRADDHGDSVVQLAPPLISDQNLFDEIEAILRRVFTDAWDHLQTRGNAWH